jgi:hypothetical protein
LRVLPAATQCGIDNVATIGTMVAVGGWAIDGPAGDVAGGVAVVLDGVVHPAYYGLRKDGVARTLGSDRFLFSGFECLTPAGKLGPGKHKISLKVQTRDHKAVFRQPADIELTRE